MLNKIKKLPQGVKASVAFFFASLVSKGIAYIVTPIYTRIMPPEVYGQTSVFLMWFEVFGIIAMFCLSYGVFNIGMIDYPDKRDEYSFSMLVLSNVITLAFSLVLLLIYPLIQSFVGLDIPLVILMLVLFVVLPAYNFWTARQRYEFKYKYTVIWTILSAILSPTIAIICILTTDGSKLYARLFGAELTLAFIYLGFYIYLAIKSKFKVNFSYWKGALLFNLPLIPHYLSTYLLGNSNKLLISNLIGDAEVAYYSVAYSVASIVTILWTAINSSLVPYTCEKCKEKDYASIAKVVNPILTIFAAGCVGVIMFAPEVVLIMSTPDYMDAIYVIPPIVGGVFFQVHYYIYANIVYYYKKPKYVMFASVISLILNFIVGYVLISNFGYFAAGYVTLSCYLLQASLDYLAMKKVVKEDVYNMRYIGLLSFAVLAISLLSIMTYDYIVIRYGIIVILIIAAILLRKKIVNIFNEIKKG